MVSKIKANLRVAECRTKSCSTCIYHSFNRKAINNCDMLYEEYSGDADKLVCDKHKKSNRK